MLAILNIGLFVLHNVLIVFNLTGWIWLQTRRIHLLMVGATLFSWFVMGAWRGWGYCLCTDWHFRIRRKLDIHGGESSYTEMLFNQIPGITVSRTFADIATVSGLILILFATSCVWIRDGSRSAVAKSGRPAPLIQEQCRPADRGESTA